MLMRVTYKPFMVCVVMLNAIMLRVVMLSVVVPNTALLTSIKLDKKCFAEKITFVDGI
jgi:hypothetical protein